jgi:hypothetical protein
MGPNNQVPRGKLNIGDSSSPKMRLLLAAAGGLMLLIIAVVFISILSSTSSGDTTTLVAIAQQQTELARISQQPAMRATKHSTENFAATAQLSLSSERQILLSFLQKNGVKPDKKTLSGTQNTRTDTALQTAQTNGTYDTAYVSIMQSGLNSYEQKLRQTFANAKSASEKQLLSNAYTHAQLLVEQSNKQ